MREAKLQAGMKEMRTGEGWGKVAANINSKQGEYKGKKDVNRMREAILHRLDDDSR